MRIASPFVRAVAAALGILIALELLLFAVAPSWSISASAVSPASAQQIWLWYADTHDVPHWDHLVTNVKSDGPFASGTTGANIGTNGLVMPWTLVDVVPYDRYTEVSRLPLATVTATHVLSRVSNGVRIDHAVIVSGPLAWLYRLMSYSELDAGMHAALERLATSAALRRP